jgi:hypothetical protein
MRKQVPSICSSIFWTLPPYSELFENLVQDEYAGAEDMLFHLPDSASIYTIFHYR